MRNMKGDEASYGVTKTTDTEEIGD